MSSWLSLLEKEMDPADMERTLKEVDKGRDAADFLLEENIVSPKVLLFILSDYWKLPYIELADYSPDEDAVNKVPEESARRFGCMPLFRQEDRLYVALSNPKDLHALDYLRRLTGLTIEPVLAARRDIEDAVNRHYLSKEKTARTMEAYREEKKEEGEEKTAAAIEFEHAPAIKLINYILSQAISLGASDVHLEPFPSRVMLRYRVDGILHEFPPPPLHLLPSLTTRIKIIANMDVAERRRPQDGRSTFTVENRDYDLRISIIPTLYGESCVIRILDTKGKKKDLEELGFSDEMLTRYKKLIRIPYGILLATGPTGAGKTTTLYASLRNIYTPKKKIITLEDPVEYQLEGITQFQVHPEIDFTFASGLRSMLRHDPDIIMVGEVRDLDTAEIAIRSSLTGHLVFSTLHTNDAPTAVTRLTDMGLPPFLVFASLIGVIAQRLVRKLCPECKTEIKLTASELEALKLQTTARDIKVSSPVGCSYCNNLGYKGRTAIYELMEITPEMKHLSREDAKPSVIREMARTKNFKSLRESALEKLFSGITSVEEVLNITIEEE